MGQTKLLFAGFSEIITAVVVVVVYIKPVRRLGQPRYDHTLTLYSKAMNINILLSLLHYIMCNDYYFFQILSKASTLLVRLT